MNYFFRFLCLFGLTLVLFSCKNDPKNETGVEPLKENAKPDKKVLTEKEKKRITSIMTKTMSTIELKSFASFIVTTGLADKLLNEEGPFTIIAPSNDAFSKVDAQEMKSWLNPSNREQLIKLVKNHIVSGNLTSATLVQNIKAANGSYKIVSLSGSSYIASLDGTNIIITDSKGVKAVIGKSDIIGSNGILHVLDTVLDKD